MIQIQTEIKNNKTLIVLVLQSEGNYTKLTCFRKKLYYYTLFKMEIAIPGDRNSAFS